MANFARLDDNNIVASIVHISNDDILDERGAESEVKGIALCNEIIGTAKWVQTSIHHAFRGRYGDVGFYYDDINDVFIAPRPAPWFVLNDQFDWVCPENINIDTGEEYTRQEILLKDLMEILSSDNFSFTYDGDIDEWVSECKTNNDRKLRTFHIWNALDASGSALYPNACSTTNYVIQSMEEVTHGTDSISSFVVELSDTEDIAQYNKIAKHFVVLDLSPIALITYQEFKNIDVELFSEAMKIHPQAAARNIDELFRLIIEWAWSYAELNSREPMAQMCHDILRAVQMPHDVRQEILALRPQPVARFIIGDNNALNEYSDSEPMPQLFKRWISRLYQQYRSRNVDSSLHLDINDLPSSYPL